jgi:cation transport ATPase
MTCEKGCAQRVKRLLEAQNTLVSFVRYDFPNRKFFIDLMADDQNAAAMAVDFLVSKINETGKFTATVVEPETITLAVQGMICAKGCAQRVKRLLEAQENVASVTFDFPNRLFFIKPTTPTSGTDTDADGMVERLIAVINNTNKFTATPGAPCTSLPAAVPCVPARAAAISPEASIAFNSASPTDIIQETLPSCPVLVLPLSPTSVFSHEPSSTTLDATTTKTTITTTTTVEQKKAISKSVAPAATIDLFDSTFMETAMLVTGMTCASCSHNIESFLGRQSGIVSAVVSLSLGKATVRYDPKIVSVQSIGAMIDDLGYHAILDANNSGGAPNNQSFEIVQQAELRTLKRDFLTALLFTIPIFLFSMVLPSIRACSEFVNNSRISGVATTDVILLILTTPVQFYVGKRFYIHSWKALKHGTTTMDVLVALGTSAAFFYSVVVVIYEAENTDFEGHTFFETSAVLITFILAGKCVEAMAKHKTSEALSKLLRLQPAVAKLLIFDPSNPRLVLEAQEVPVEQVKVNDVLIIKTGDRVPLDGRVIFGSIYADESAITGESVPVHKPIDSSVIGGTITVSGMAHVRVEKIGQDTALAQIIKLVEDAQSSKAPIQEFADRVSRLFVPAVIAM